MHEECLKGTEGTAESGYLWTVMKIGWRVGIFLYLNNSVGHVQSFILRVYHFCNLKSFMSHSMLVREPQMIKNQILVKAHFNK